LNASLHGGGDNADENQDAASSRHPCNLFVQEGKGKQDADDGREVEADRCADNAERLTSDIPKARRAMSAVTIGPKETSMATLLAFV